MPVDLSLILPKYGPSFVGLQKPDVVAACAEVTSYPALDLGSLGSYLDILQTLYIYLKVQSKAGTGTTQEEKWFNNVFLGGNAAAPAEDVFQAALDGFRGKISDTTLKSKVPAFTAATFYNLAEVEKILVALVKEKEAGNVPAADLPAFEAYLDILQTLYIYLKVQSKAGATPTTPEEKWFNNVFLGGNAANPAEDVFQAALEGFRNKVSDTTLKGKIPAFDPAKFYVLAEVEKILNPLMEILYAADDKALTTPVVCAPPISRAQALRNTWRPTAEVGVGLVNHEDRLAPTAHGATDQVPSMALKLGVNPHIVGGVDALVRSETVTVDVPVEASIEDHVHTGGDDDAVRGRVSAGVDVALPKVPIAAPDLRLRWAFSNNDEGYPGRGFPSGTGTQFGGELGLTFDHDKISRIPEWLRLRPFIGGQDEYFAWYKETGYEGFKGTSRTGRAGLGADFKLHEKYPTRRWTAPHIEASAYGLWYGTQEVPEEGGAFYGSQPNAVVGKRGWGTDLKFTLENLGDWDPYLALKVDHVDLMGWGPTNTVRTKVGFWTNRAGGFELESLYQDLDPYYGTTRQGNLPLLSIARGRAIAWIPPWLNRSLRVAVISDRYTDRAGNTSEQIGLSAGVDVVRLFMGEPVKTPATSAPTPPTNPLVTAAQQAVGAFEGESNEAKLRAALAAINALPAGTDKMPYQSRIFAAIAEFAWNEDKLAETKALAAILPVEPVFQAIKTDLATLTVEEILLYKIQYRPTAVAKDKVIAHQAQLQAALKENQAVISFHYDEDGKDYVVLVEVQRDAAGNLTNAWVVSGNLPEDIYIAVRSDHSFSVMDKDSGWQLFWAKDDVCEAELLFFGTQLLNPAAAEPAAASSLFGGGSTP